MKIARLALLIVLMTGALLHQSDGQQVRPLADQLRLAGMVPKGALLYLQARDLSALMKTWLASSERKALYDSSSFAQFSQSHLYLKLQTRKADFDNALGFSLDEDRLAELAGGASAVGMYDIGKLELVFVTEVPRTKAIATTLFKSIPKFEERSANGTAYYVRDVTTDGGRLNQEFCFSYSNGRLIITTAEALMIRALGAAADGSNSMLPDVMATAEKANGFAAHDVTLWVDQARLNKSQHFVSYWIYHNTAQSDEASLANIDSGLIDLSFATDGMHEHRWFLLKTAGNANAEAMPISQASVVAFTRFVPPSAQMFQMHGQPAANEVIGSAISRALFGRLPDDSATAPGTPNNPPPTDSSEGERSDRYSSLDARFDMDVDDDSGASLSSDAVGASSKKTGQAGSRFQKSIAPFLSGIAPDAYCEMTRSRVDQGKSFVRFERAVVLEMKDGASVDKAALERLITGEFRSRFVIAGIEPRIEWQNDSVRSLAQSLIEQGAAYAVSGRYLILASSKEFARDILAARSSAAKAGRLEIGDGADTYAVVRIADAQPVFDLLMAKLDGRMVVTPATTSSDDESKEDDDTNKESGDSKQDVKFFSDNISGLTKALAIREVQLERRTAGSLMTERVDYLW